MVPCPFYGECREKEYLYIGYTRYHGVSRTCMAVSNAGLVPKDGFGTIGGGEGGEGGK